ncbi:MAG: hypothetical protein M3Z29_05235 [Pseudomonadota bacterium]|nr:hypothetical protein [Pseudomonadota bacterium]
MNDPFAGALLEAIDRDGAVRQAWRIDRWPVRIGRALDNDVVLGDPHVAAHHASIDVRQDGSADAPPQLLVTAEATLNGLGIGRERIAGGQTQAIVDTGRDLELHLGRTLLRLRLPGHALAPELVIAPLPAREPRWLPTVGLIVLLLGLVLVNTFIDSDPDNLARASSGALLMALAGGAVWCGLWALLSKIFARQSHFGWHVRVFVIASLATLALGVLPPLLAFALSWPAVTDFSFVALYATLATALYFHLLAVEPGRQRLMRGVAAAGFVAGVALALWFNVQRTGRLGEELYMNHLFPPAVRLAKPVQVDRFVDGLVPLQAILDRQAKDPSGAGNDAHGSEDDDN